MIDAAPLETIVDEDEEGDSDIIIDLVFFFFYFLERYYVFIEIVVSIFLHTRFLHPLPFNPPPPPE